MTFFSSTDINTLKEEGKDTNHFVSLIVNNAGIYTAAITRKVSCISKGTNSIKYNTFNNVSINENDTDFEKEYTYIEYYTLEVTKEEIPVTPKSELELRLEEVRKNASSYINRKVFNTTAFSNNVKPYNSFSKEQEAEPSKPSTEPKYKQLSLFPEKDMETVKKEETKIWEPLEDAVGYDVDHINPIIIRDTVTQIITGDIFSIYKQNIDLDKWAANMTTLYSKRFPDAADGNSFKYWVDTYLEFLENEIYDDILYDKGRDYMDAIWAYDVIVELQKYPSNPFMEEFIDALNRWLI